MPAELYRLVTGDIADGDEAEELLAHASLCERCGQVLARTSAALEGNPSAEEAAAIQELIARKDWKRELAQTLAASRTRRRPLLQKIPPRRWMAAGAIAASIAALAALAIWQREIGSPEHQLAEAYTQSRTMEMRIPDGSYAGLTSGQHTRGAMADREPASLLDARAQIARELERTPQDRHWLELLGRAELLEERYDSAIDGLDRQIGAGPVTAELLTDAAAAYYQRGQATGSELDRSTALDYLRRADGIAPTNPVVLFNEAIVMQDRGQMMSAVEVWNRYVTVEQDPKWAAEGKRKLAQLEQTLNPLKSHQSRVDQMLGSPEKTNALTADVLRLKALDEELATYDLAKLFRLAFPVRSDNLKGAPKARDIQTDQARGSPCDQSCQAARKLLQALAYSLETQHQDYWLSDLLSPEFESLPLTTQSIYAQALNFLGEAIDAGTSGLGGRAGELATTSQRLFQELNVSDKGNTAIQKAAHVGLERAEFESLFALQRKTDFDDCRDYARQLEARDHDVSRYPWIVAVRWITMKVCDETPDTRTAGNKLLEASQLLSEKHQYRLLLARGRARQAGDAELDGDAETAEHLTIGILRELYASDAPVQRIAGTISEFSYIEENTPRIYAHEVYLRESAEWFALMKNNAIEAATRMDLARTEIRLGHSKEAENEIRLAQAASLKSRQESGEKANFVEADIFLAKTYLEAGDSSAASRYLDDAATSMSAYSDEWGLRTYAEALGQLQLSRGRLNQAAQTLEAEIRASEGKAVSNRYLIDVAENVQQDHDLYAELTATYLAQGRKPESALALWERFLLRSRGSPVPQCRDGALDCTLPMLRSAQQKLGGSMVIGQVVLLDRVLLYKMDRKDVLWIQKSTHRQDLLDEALTLERAVSWPQTTPEAAGKLGKSLGEALLPDLPRTFDPDDSLLLEADPLLQNLSWPVLPTSNGALGLKYPLAEMRSILAPDVQPMDHDEGKLQDRRLLLSKLDSQSSHPLLIGASAASGDVAPLPEAIAEVESVNRFMVAPQLLTGKQATTTAIGGALENATIFHFAGHAVQSKGGTELLVSAASGRDTTPWLDGAFLRAHQPRACKLAVLSACATGGHEAGWNHPLQDIVETLGTLGVPEVVATRWQIDSEASVPLMNDFYRGLANGDTVALALTSARQLQSAKPLYRNPYYWGAYYVSGRETTYLRGEFHASLQKGSSK